MAFALSFAGAALLSVPAQRFRIDRAGDDCSAWPAISESAAYAAVYLVALALLTLGWRRAIKLEWPLGRVLAVGFAVHAVAMLAPPFLSLDTLCYSAVGRAMAAFHQSPYAPLRATLPAGDRFLTLLPPGWQFGGSAYWPLFNRLSQLIALAAGDHLIVHLRLYQLTGALAMTAVAWLTAAAVGDSKAAAFVLFCPLAIVEATVNGHNDNLLALSVALFAFCVARRQQTLGALSLIAGLLVKASGLLVLGMDVCYLAFSRVRRFVTAARVLGAGAIFIAATITAFIVLRRTFPFLNAFSALLGSPADAFEHCTRSFECFPRGALRYVFHQPTAAWIVGLAFRAAGGLWLVYAALRAAKEQRQLAWAACGLFIYYLFLHGFMESWYLLSLLPLVPHADERLRPAMQVYLVSALVYYAIRLPLNCSLSPALIGLKELSEGLVVLVPVVVTLARRRRTA
ncbi:MAG TPA: hypothetical protein VFF06_01755 [Polyangia bacterium]|nr:hypothetical protein [Polyangia bacterium]